MSRRYFQIIATELAIGRARAEALLAQRCTQQEIDDFWDEMVEAFARELETISLHFDSEKFCKAAHHSELQQRTTGRSE